MAEYRERHTALHSRVFSLRGARSLFLSIETYLRPSVHVTNMGKPYCTSSPGITSRSFRLNKFRFVNARVSYGNCRVASRRAPTVRGDAVVGVCATVYFIGNRVEAMSGPVYARRTPVRVVKLRPPPLSLSLPAPYITFSFIFHSLRRAYNRRPRPARFRASANESSREDSRKIYRAYPKLSNRFYHRKFRFAVSSEIGGSIVALASRATGRYCWSTVRV